MTTTVFVTGTGTDVGKTWVLVGLAGAWRADGRPLTVRKPAQSYAPAELGTTDAELLAAATGVDAETVCPAHRWYATPMAPPMAAAALGAPSFTIADLAAETLALASGAGPRFVEGAGGPRSPLAADGDNVDQLREGHASPIVPVPCGDEARALELAAALLDRGLLVPAIRPPTVPPGTARLRIALSAAHTLDQVRTLRAALDELTPPR